MTQKEMLKPIEDALKGTGYKITGFIDNVVTIYNIEECTCIAINLANESWWLNTDSVITLAEHRMLNRIFINLEWI